MMIRTLAKLTIQTISYNKFVTAKLFKIQPTLFKRVPLYRFSTLPKHQVLTMPALSPTMTQGKIVKWIKKVGQQVQPGDLLCEIETDKATVGFQVQQKAYIAKINSVTQAISVGAPLIVLTKKAESVKQFSNYQFGTSSTQQPKSQPPKQQAPSVSSNKEVSTQSSNYPKYTPLKMPALSPTMTSGKILKWNVKEGDAYKPGDIICQVQTDKAVVDYQVLQKGYIAKIIGKSQQNLAVGDLLAVSVKKKEDIEKFKNFTKQDGKQVPSSVQSIKTEKQQKKTQQQSRQASSTSPSSSERVFASPAAKQLANQKGIQLNNMRGLGSGPDGRVIKQDVQGFKVPEPVSSQQQKNQKQQSTPSPKIHIPQNPFQQIALTGMRKTIASRLLQSKTTIPHYYVNLQMQMDAINAVRNQLNKGQKQNGVKISVNDIIIKAMALSLRDYPDVNAQWNVKSIKKFKHADIGVAVATQGGLITPIVFRAQTLGLIDIAKRTKDIAKRARQGKLDPSQYIGGTSTISNIGMYGVDSVTSVINPPQSTILGVGQTSKKIVFNALSTDVDKPYRVADMCQMIVSADHRVVDGALAAQWLKRIQKYLQNPNLMLL